MIPSSLIAAVVAVVAANILFYRWYIGFARERNLTDIPNYRSSHDRPVPGAGGMGFGGTAILAFAGFAIFSGQGMEGTLVATMACMAGVLLTGLLDDFYQLSRQLRIAVYTAVGIAVLLFVGGLPTFYIPLVGSVSTGVAGPLLVVLWMVGWINAYNFMDGMDGMAALQALTAALGWCVFAWLWYLPELLALNGLLMAGVGVFLVFNWAPARVFMGDGGSVFLGLTFGLMPFLAAALSEEITAGFAVWLAALLLWPFLFDALFTFIRRLVRREKVFTAHRTHLFQRLHRSGWSHEQVTLLYFCYGLFCLGGALLFGGSGEGTRAAVAVGVVLFSLIHLWLVRRAEMAK